MQAIYAPDQFLRRAYDKMRYPDAERSKILNGNYVPLIHNTFPAYSYSDTARGRDKSRFQRFVRGVDGKFRSFEDRGADLAAIAPKRIFFVQRNVFTAEINSFKIVIQHDGCARPHAYFNQLVHIEFF